MTDILKLASEIIEDGNFNKLNVLLTLPISQELVQTLRRIFFYLQDQKIFKIYYGQEWNQWDYLKVKRINDSNQIENFLNTKWSVFLRLLFQYNYYHDILQCIEQSINSPPYVKLVQLSLEKGIELPVHNNYFKTLQFLEIDFGNLILLLKRLPQIEEQDKPEYTIFIQKQISKINGDEERMQFSKIIHSHIVDKVENPLILADFLQNNIDNGNLELQINSLQSMLILMTRFHYNLDNFYQKLLQIINTEGAFQTQSRSKLLKIIDVATKSSKVPLQILTQIIKSVLECCLTESCSLQLWAVQLVFNVFKKQMTLKQFLQTGENQLKELASYQDHWHPEIKKIVGYLQDDLSIFDYFNLNDILELNDTQLLEAIF